MFEGRIVQYCPVEMQHWVVQRVVSLVMLGDGVFGVGDDVTWRQWAYVYRGGEDVHWRTICHLNNALLEDLCHRG